MTARESENVMSGGSDGGPSRSRPRDGGGSPSQTSPTGSPFTSFRDRVSRALSPNRDAHHAMERRTSFGKTMSQIEEGRGRQPIVSTGRGGAGNLVRSPSRGVDPDTTASIERGREIHQRDVSVDRVTHSGRGGAGNIRSPSRDPRDAIAEAKEDALQARLVAEERGRQASGNLSTGRGGVGNISRSKSRSRSQAREPRDGAVTHNNAHQTPEGKKYDQPHLRSGGRGGWGNISEEHDRDSIEEQKLVEARKYEDQVHAKHHAEEEGRPHVIGKGGAGNLQQSVAPVDMSTLTLEEREAYDRVHARDGEHGGRTGRGGAGNYHKPDGSPVDGERGRGRGDHKDKGGVFGNVLRSLSKAAGRDKSADKTA